MTFFVCPFCLSLFVIYLGNRVFCYTGAIRTCAKCFRVFNYVHRSSIKHKSRVQSIQVIFRNSVILYRCFQSPKIDFRAILLCLDLSPAAVTEQEENVRR
jgi:hypothetical protein